MSEITTEAEDQYFTIDSPARAEERIMASRFIAYAHPIRDKEHAMEIVDEYRREFFDATHHCFAYRLGKYGLEFRAADDREPSGTAGKPILFAIQKYTLSDILVVVIRYFGGTKLGRERLAKAYSEAANLVLAKVTRKIVYRTHTVKVFCVYEDLKFVLPLLEKYAVHMSSDYRDAIEFTVKIQRSQVAECVEAIGRATNARAGCVVEEEED